VKRAIVIVLALLSLGGAYVWKHAYYDRYVWPRSAPEMQDLPAFEITGTAAPWSNETLSVEAATPDGLRTIRVTYFINSIGMRLVQISPGTFLMGEKGQQASRRPEIIRAQGKPTTITNGFYLGAFEVTNRQFEQFKNHPRPKYQRGKTGDDHPVEPVTWREAQEFCRWLSLKENRRYRLPAEAEWEYACRAGTQTRLYWGDAFWDRNKANLGGTRLDRETWKDDGYEFTAPVGTYPPNPWGLFDMIGNSWEWVADWYEGNAYGHCRVYKGGNWKLRLRQANCGSRDGDDPADLPDIRGFRVLCEQ
jgi:formylglycine-generating enzyme required for sulfatase activity